MKFTIERAAAREAVAVIGALVRRAQTIEILSNFHIVAKGGGIRITATDLNIQGSCVADARIEREGEITVPADKFSQIIESLPEGAEVAFEIEEGATRATMKSGRSRFQLPMLPATDFPMLRPTMDGETSHAFTMKAPSLLRLIDRGAVVMGSDKSVAYLNCAFMVLAGTPEGPVMRMVSTDKKSFAVCDAAAPPEELPEGLCARITPETVKLVSSAFKDQTGDIAVTITPGRVVFAGGRIGIIAKQLDGNYVEYERAIPRQFAHVMTVDTDLVTALIRRAAIMSSAMDGGVRLTADAAGLLSATARDAKSGGEANDQIECALDGEGFVIALNAARALTVLGMVETENVVISIVAKGGPVLFEATGDSDWFAFIGQMAT